VPSRHDYRISALQQNILLEVPSLGDLAVAEANGGLTRALAWKHANVSAAAKRSHAAAMLIACITSIDAAKESHGSVDLANDENPIAIRCLTETVTTAPARACGRGFQVGSPIGRWSCLRLAYRRQGKRDPAIWSDQHFTLQIGFFHTTTCSTSPGCNL